MLEDIDRIVSDRKFQDDVISFLVDICSVNTTAISDIAAMARNEGKVFDMIRDRLHGFSFKEATISKKKISPAIQDHPAFSKLHFTKTDSRHDGLSPESVYRDRYNLLYFLDGETSGKGRNPAINAHIDVVAPFFPPERKGDILSGRGTIDDKGGIAVIYGSLAVLDRLNREDKLKLKNRITAMFVTEEETGGNGSLDLALDRVLKKRYDSVLVLECAGNKVYPANRGAVWFKCCISLAKENDRYSKPEPSPLESMVFSILEMQLEGDRIREESNHPLFPHKPVQTCNGILGPFGEHPSRICGYVSFALKGIKSRNQYSKIIGCIETGLKRYIDKYGDKTRYLDKVTGKPRIEKHFDTGYDPESESMNIHVYGSTGHMGSILEHEPAITKWAFMAREILYYKTSKNLDLYLELENHDSSGQIILEGGQGFLPTHPIEIIQDRMREAFIRGGRMYLGHTGAGDDVLSFAISFDKLHNNAYSGDPGSPSFRNALEAGIRTGMLNREDPVRGWDVSCDARLFAGEYPGMPVITSGPGELSFAHADNEQIHLPDLFKSITFCALYLLKETGSI